MPSRASRETGRKPRAARRALAVSARRTLALRRSFLQFTTRARWSGYSDTMRVRATSLVTRPPRPLTWRLGSIDLARSRGPNGKLSRG
jgi:hypothetical protein